MKSKTISSSTRWEKQLAVIVGILFLCMMASTATAGNTLSNTISWIQGVYFDNTNDVVDFNDWDVEDIDDLEASNATFEFIDGGTWTDSQNASGEDLYEVNITDSTFYFGTTNGYYSETKPNRPISSIERKEHTVCSSGCDYTSIQDAVDDVPLILRHRYRITISDGTYDEDVYVPPIITSVTDGSEGSTIPLRISGNTADINAVKVKSIQVSGIVGAWGVQLRAMNLYGEEPRSDENTSLSIYGSNSVLINNINFTGNVVYAILPYSSSVYIHSCHFTTNQSYALNVKGNSNVIFGDYYLSQANTGSVSNYVISMSSSFASVNYNLVTAPNGLVNCREKAGIINSYDNETETYTSYCINTAEPTNREVSRQGLVLSANFNNETVDTTNNYVYGSSRNNLKMTYNGTIHHSTGGYNSGGFFEFVNPKVDWINVGAIPDNPFVNNPINGTNATVDFWINPESGGLTEQYILTLGSTSRFVFYYHESSNQIRFRTRYADDSAYHGYYVSSKIYATDGWVHFGATINGTTLKSYVNGELHTESEIDYYSCATNVNYIGSGGAPDSSSRNFEGDIDNVEVYDRVLSDDEMRAKYRQRKEPMPSFVSQKDISTNTTAIYPTKMTNFRTYNFTMISPDGTVGNCGMLNDKSIQCS